MGERTGIQWTDATLNPWIGCTKVSPGCDNCYAEALMDHRYGRVQWGPHGERKRTKTWGEPLKWQRQADAFEAEHGRRRRVFCASLADVFDNQVPPEWRADLWELIRKCDRLDWQLLTKRPQNIKKMLPSDWGNGWPHVWLGTTAENQTEADRRIPDLLATPAAVRFVSYEPALSGIDFTRIAVPRAYGTFLFDALRGAGGTHLGEPFSSMLAGRRLDLVIAGGESGPRKRPVDLAWFRSARDQCKSAGVAYFQKQIDKVQPIPDDLQIREFPR